MKTLCFLLGAATLYALQCAWKYRTTLVPWLRTEEIKVVAKLSKKKTPLD